MTRCASSKAWWSATFIALAATAASAQSTSTTPPDTSTTTKTAPTAQPEKPTTITAPTSMQPAAQTPAEGRVVTMGPTREIKLADYTFIRFGFQVQAWVKAAQDRIQQPDGTEGTFAYDFYCRRCRLFATGSVVKDVNFNILFEAANLGKADPLTGAKSFVAPSILDAYAQVRFADAFYLSAGSILLPLNRNANQPTTTYLSIDTANLAATPAGQGNTNVLRDLGVQANGFLLADHLEYRLGVFQGTRAPAKTRPGATPTSPPVLDTQTAGHNPPRLVASLQANFWDTEKGYVNGGHYYGTKKVFGVAASFDYQTLRTFDPPSNGTSKDPYIGVSAATFINYPLSGTADPKRGGDELVGLLQGGFYDGGTTKAFSPVDPKPSGSYPLILRQFNLIAEGAYYSQAAKTSIFGRFEMRKVSHIYDAATQAGNNTMWFAGGLKYYLAPANLLNFGLQYERIQYPDALAGTQSGTHNVTAQMQLLLY